MAPFIEISGRRIGPGYPVYIVAEMSANQDGRFDRAVELVKTAKACGADAIRLQTYSPDTPRLTATMTISGFKAHYRTGVVSSSSI